MQTAHCKAKLGRGRPNHTSEGDRDEVDRVGSAALPVKNSLPQFKRLNQKASAVRHPGELDGRSWALWAPGFSSYVYCIWAIPFDAPLYT